MHLKQKLQDGGLLVCCASKELPNVFIEVAFVLRAVFSLVRLPQMDFETTAVSAVSVNIENGLKLLFRTARERCLETRLELISGQEQLKAHAFKDAMNPVWRGLCGAVEASASMVALQAFDKFMELLEHEWNLLTIEIQELTRCAINFKESPGTATVPDVSGSSSVSRRLLSSFASFYLLQTSVFRVLSLRSRLVGGSYRAVILAEASLPADTKGGCNLFRARFEGEGDIESGVMFNLKESLKSPEAVFKSVLAWTKFHKFVKDGLGALQETSDDNCSNTFAPIEVLGRIQLCSKQAQRRIATQVAIALHAVELQQRDISANATPLSDNALKQLESLKTTVHAILGDSRHFAKNILVGENAWSDWKSMGSSFGLKEACGALTEGSRTERGLSVLGKSQLSGDIIDKLPDIMLKPAELLPYKRRASVAALNSLKIPFSSLKPRRTVTIRPIRKNS